ncbi:MAG: dihydroorotase [Proteobacteria bacterium]|nr:dihydroorotase [Pseudomonadota bacterium]
MQTLTIIYPDDWHCHLRNENALATTVPYAAKQFKRVVAMPNLQPPVCDVDAALNYLQEIKAHIPEGADFTPLMTLYLTDKTTTKTIYDAKEKGIFGCKLYPAGVTTHSTQGVTSLEALYPVFATMAKQQMPLLIHGEVNDKSVDIFDREKRFIEQHLVKLTQEFPELKVVLEHITTKEAVQFIESTSSNVAATITPQHLLLNRNDLLAGGIKPHHYCLPILKRSLHQETLIKAATSANPKFFIGTDSAPHAKKQKESACGCAGIFSHHGAIELYAQAFEQANALDKLEGFTSKFGPDFYGFAYNKAKLTLKRIPWVVPKTIPYAQDVLVPLFAEKTLAWQISYE